MNALGTLAITAGVLAGIACAGVVQSAPVNNAKATPPAPATRRQLVPTVIVPIMDPVRGEHLFVSKGCVICHSINGVGGTTAPKLDARTKTPTMNPFDFFARMWRGAAPMIALQEHDLSHQVEFTGQDLADIAAFVYDRQLQKNFDAADNQPAKK